VELTKAQNEKDQQFLENYKENPNTRVSRPDLENAFRAVCCTGLRSRGKRALSDGPICRWIRRVKAEID